MEHRIENYKEAWKPQESILLSSLQEVSRLTFFRNVIDVNVVSGNPRAFSRPIVVKSGHEPEEFVCVLLHELVHVLFSDNTGVFVNDFQTIFPQEERETAVHIPVFAVMKLALERSGKAELLETAFALAKKHSSKTYSRAWEIVFLENSDDVIKKIKKPTAP